MKIISLFLICSVLFACSSTKVHLYTRYLSEQEASDITEKLEIHNFEVIANTLAYPDEIVQSTLLYSPFVQGENNLNVLINTLDELGWTIPNVQPLLVGNHYYTKNSVGLLLIPDDVDRNDKVAAPDLVNQYQSKGCDIPITLMLNKDTTYQFSHFKKNKTNHLKGNWKITSYPYLELTSTHEEWSYYFEIRKKAEVDIVGKIELIELKPVDSHYLFPNCNFYYGLRI